MEPAPSKPTILKIRTFADDVKRASGGTVTVPTATPAVSTPSTPASPLQSAINAEVARSQPTKNVAPLDIARPAAMTPAAEAHAAFDIRSEASSDIAQAEATIIRDHRAKRWSFSTEFILEAKKWYEEIVRAFTPPQAPATIVADVAPSMKPAVAPATTEQQLAAAPTTPPQTLTPIVPAPQAPSDASWRRISEPRANAPLAHTTDEEAKVYLEKLHSLKPIQPQRAEPVHAFKQARVVRPDTSARERLAALAEKARIYEEQPPQEKAAPREIPFIPPTYVRSEAATPLRTYRTDAIEDVQERDLSKEKIAAAELARRAAGKAPIVFSKPPSRFPVVLATLGVVLIVGALGAILYTQFGTSETPAPIVQGESFFKADRSTDVPLTSDRNTFLTALASTKATASVGSDEVLELRVTNGSGERATAVDVLTVVDPRAPGSFLRSLGPVIMWGAYGTNRVPYLVLTTTSFDVGFAGMLTWEDAISADLAPFFGEPVRRSYDSEALTLDQTRPAHFKDYVVGNMDARRMLDETGGERMLYALVDENIIVIAGDAVTLEAIARELR